MKSRKVKVNFSFIRDNELKLYPIVSEDNSGIDLFASQSVVINPINKLDYVYQIIDLDLKDKEIYEIEIIEKEKALEKGRILKANSFKESLSNDEYETLTPLIYVNRVYNFQFIKTNIRIDLTENTTKFDSYLYLRSSISSRYHLALANQTGVIDLSYNGKEDEIMFSVYSRGESSIYIPSGTKVGQLVIKDKVDPYLNLQYDLSELESRGGFGSTGLS